MSAVTAVAGPASLHESTLDRLGADIVAGRLAAGHVLRMEQAEGDYGVSRSVIREAVRVLEAMRLVAVRRRVGVTVQPRECWNPFDPRVIRWRLDGPDRDRHLHALSELRSGVEPTAARLAATHATAQQCGALTEAVIGMAVSAKAGDLEAYLGHDIAFHRTLLTASGNEMFHGLGDVVAEVLAGRTHHGMMPRRPEPVAVRLHGDIAQAVQAGDAAAAEEAMRAIITEATSALTRLGVR